MPCTRHTAPTTTCTPTSIPACHTLPLTPPLTGPLHSLQGKGVIFMETAMGLRTHKHHAALECVPVSMREQDKAPGFFKKAMQEAESEWSQHHAKAVIETNAKKVGLAGCGGVLERVL